MDTLSHFLTTLTDTLLITHLFISTLQGVFSAAMLVGNATCSSNTTFLLVYVPPGKGLKYTARITNGVTPRFIV